MNRRSFLKNMAGCAALAVSLNLPINVLNYVAKPEQTASKALTPAEALARAMRETKEKAVARVLNNEFI